MHKRSHSADISIKKRNDQLKSIAKLKTPPSGEIPAANTTTLDAKQTSMALHSRSNSEFVLKVNGTSGSETPRQSLSRQESATPAIMQVQVLSPTKEIDYGNRRIEGVEKRVIDVGLKIPQTSGAADEKSWTGERGRTSQSRSINSDLDENKALWWDRLTGRKRKVSKSRLDV